MAESRVDSLRKALKTFRSTLLDRVNIDNIINECISSSIVTSIEHEDIGAERTPRQKVGLLLDIVNKKAEKQTTRFLQIVGKEGGCLKEVKSIRIAAAIADSEKELFQLDSSLKSQVVQDVLRELPDRQRRRLEKMNSDDLFEEVVKSVVPQDEETFFAFLTSLEKQQFAQLVEQMTEHYGEDEFKLMEEAKPKEYCFMQITAAKVEHRRTRRVFVCNELRLTAFSDPLIDQIVKEFKRIKDSLSSTAQDSMKKVCHQGQIVTIVTDFFEEESLLMILKKRVDRRMPFSEEETTEWMCDIARSLNEMHRVDVIHGNLRPENIVRTSEGVKLLDVGVTAIIRAQSAKSSTLLAYCAPEVTGKKKVDRRSDAWSLGAIAYHLLTGKEWSKAGEGNRSCTGILGQVIHDLLAEDPNKRPELDDVLDRLEPRPETPEAPEAPEASQSPEPSEPSESSEPLSQPEQHENHAPSDWL